MEILMLNVAVIVLVVIFAGAIGNKDFMGWTLAWFAFCVCLALSIIGWLIYVVAHFVIKYW